MQVGKLGEVEWPEAVLSLALLHAFHKAGLRVVDPPPQWLRQRGLWPRLVLEWLMRPLLGPLPRIR